MGSPRGEVAEWLNALLSKSSKGASPSGVRIPLSPPFVHMHYQFEQILLWIDQFGNYFVLIIFSWKAVPAFYRQVYRIERPYVSQRVFV